jgi:pimeloyl-ACP methyl ester carboxylesterase
MKVFDTLRVLVEHSGRLLTKHELMDSIWPDAAVEENNLNHNISTLRRALGEQATGQRYIETVPRVGYRFVAAVTSARGVASALAPAPPAAAQRSLRQEIRFCTASDGTRIAYSTVGNGPPLVKAANFLNHLEYEWESPVWKHWIHEISRRHLFVRYDERGCGLSDWQIPDLSFDAWVRDLETVVDALGTDRFDLLGISQGGAVAAAYAAKHPERVRHLILFGAFECGWQVRGDARAIDEWTALITLLRLGWGRNNPVFRRPSAGFRFAGERGAVDGGNFETGRARVARRRPCTHDRLPSRRRRRHPIRRRSPPRRRYPRCDLRAAAEPQSSGARTGARMGRVVARARRIPRMDGAVKRTAHSS